MLNEWLIFTGAFIQLREKDFIPLQHELNILSDYSFLQEKRFASGLEISIDIDTVGNFVLLHPATRFCKCC
jgi:LytS/YehU family sensor histidine kinase